MRHYLERRRKKKNKKMAIGSRTVDIKPPSGDQEHAGDCMSYANFKNSNESFGKPPSRGGRSKV